MRKATIFKTRRDVQGEAVFLVEAVYDQSVGVIRISDNSIDSKVAPSLSPIKLNRTLRRNIKKPIEMKNVL